MRAIDGATMQREASDSWTAFQAAVFIGGGSILLWATVISLIGWLT